MKSLILILSLSIFLGGCMTTAQKAQQQAEINNLVSQMTPEQRGQLAQQILMRETGLDEQPAYTPPLHVETRQNLQCYNYPNGYTYCW